MKNVILLGLILTLIIIPIASAEQTVKTIEYPLSYEQYPLANTLYERNITIFPPDGIEKIESLEFLIKGDFLASTQVYGGIMAGQSFVFCNPTDWTSPTWNVDGYEIVYDCTEYVGDWKGSPTIPLQFMFQSNQIFGNAKPRVKMTYLNRPKYKANVLGTDYEPAEIAKIILMLLDENNQPIDDTGASCSASIFYPDDTIWKYRQSMSYLDEGLWVYNVELPNIAGVYPVSALCLTQSTDELDRKISDDFEDNDISGGTGWSSDWNLNGAVISTQYKYEGNYNLRMNEDDVPNRTILSEENRTSVDISFYYRIASLEAGDIAYIYMIDADGTYFLLDSWTDGDDDSNWYQWTGSLFEDGDSFNLTGNITFLFNTSGTWGSSDYTNIDLINITLKSTVPTNDTTYVEVRGSGELNVGNGGNHKAELISGEIHNYTWLDSFYFNWKVTPYVNQNTTDQEIKLWTYAPFPCHHITNVTKLNSTSGEYDILMDIKSFFIDDSEVNGRCGIEINDNLNVEEISYYRVTSDNWWKEKELTRYTENTMIYEFAEIACENYQESNGLPDYPVEIENITDALIILGVDDNLYKTCALIYDRYTHYNLTIYQSLFPLIVSERNFTVHQMETLEDLYSHINDIGNVVNSLGKTIGQSLDVIDSYSLAILQDPYPPTNPNWSIYFSQLTTSYLDYGATSTYNNSLSNLIYDINTSNDDIITEVNALNDITVHDVWNYNNRNLTSDGLYDYSLMADYVWNESSRDLTDYNQSTMWSELTQVQTDISTHDAKLDNVNASIYNYIGNVLTTVLALNDLSAVDIWTYTTRTLTADGLYDYELMSEYNWNYSSRDLTDYNQSTMYSELTQVQTDISSINSSLSTQITIIQSLVSALNDISVADVWAYSGSPSSTLLNNIAADVWSYSARYTHGIII